MMHSWIGLELFAIGILTGLRTLTPMAVLCWITVLGRFRADLESERSERVDSARLELRAIRQIVSRLRGGAKGFGVSS